ncbi:uncharacterized protein CLAFUR5_04918 [Fulvia fulva]|uniref:Ubiquitin-like domain-containing protein n=1 Tax=Passalora fulva TaxID=5499 RepID=A0A9Q8P835_PASFU|nr:uncharacterized protein CLAFUR5_04918 [Fulvia fulva]UJO16681.1 hypothetical protein CLAFUR5_04918 [Fulvia fulva]
MPLQCTTAPKINTKGERPRADSKLRSASIVVSSGSDRIVHVYPERTSSGGSASARSPASSGGSRSFSSEESWSEVEYEDDIDPSDSASRSRQPASRRHTVEARPAPQRRHSSRRVVEREEAPARRQSSRRHHTSRHESHSHSRHGRSTSRRVPSDESSSTVASADDYPPYGHHGMPRGSYAAPMPPGYGRAPPSHGGYPPSMTSAGYPDPYAPPHQALVHRQRPDPFGYPQPNPFAPQSHEANPFSPMSSHESSGYFATDPMSPPEPPQQRHPQPHGPPRPQSFAAPSAFHGSELMAPYHQPMPPYGGYAPPGYPGYPPMHGWPAPVSRGSSPAIRDEKMAAEMAALQELIAKRNDDDGKKKVEKDKEIEALKDLIEKRNDSEGKKKEESSKEIDSLKALIKKHEEESIARQKAWAAEREAEVAARAAEKARAEEEKRRKQEIDDARKKAKEDAEKKAEEAAKKAKDEHEAAAKKAKEEHEMKLAEAEKAKEEADKAKKALEDEIAKNKPTPDSLKPPIKFKDAVGRKFSFPWHLCKSWKGMEGLIKQAFLHVDVIGDHVHQGHYDLTGPDGEIILPQVWDTMVQPDWEITMHLWPMEEEKKKEKAPHSDDLMDPFVNLGMGGMPGLGPDFGMIPHHDLGKKPSKGGKKGESSKKGKKAGSPDIMMVGPDFPPPPPGHHGMPPPPGHFGDPFANLGMDPMMGGGMPKKSDKTKARSKSKSSKEISPLAAWFAGGSLNAKAPRKK